MTHNNLTAKLMQYLAKYVTSVLCVILFVCANTNSSCVLNQSAPPNGLKKYSIFK